MTRIDPLNWLWRTFCGFVAAAVAFVSLDMLTRALTSLLHGVGVPAGIGWLLAGTLVVWWFAKWVESKVGAHAQDIAAWFVIVPFAFLGVYCMVAPTVLIVVDWIPSAAERAGAPDSVQVLIGMAALLLIVCGWALLLHFLDAMVTTRIIGIGSPPQDFTPSGPPREPEGVSTKCAPTPSVGTIDGEDVEP